MIHVARHRWRHEVDPLSKTPDVVWSQEAKDRQAYFLGKAIPGAVLGDDEGAVVVDADEVASASFDLVVGVQARIIASAPISSSK